MEWGLRAWCRTTGQAGGAAAAARPSGDSTRPAILASTQRARSRICSGAAIRRSAAAHAAATRVIAAPDRVMVMYQLGPETPRHEKRLRTGATSWRAAPRPRGAHPRARLVSGGAQRRAGVHSRVAETEARRALLEGRLHVARSPIGAPR